MTPAYLDYAATTPVDERVAQVMAACLTREGAFGNPGSSSHDYGDEAQALVEAARGRVAAAVGADAADVMWTSGATEADNLAVFGIANYYVESGRHVVTVRTEHKAVLAPCRELERRGWKVTYLVPDRRGVLDPAQLHVAEEQLAMAEKSFDKDGDTFKTRDSAYVAQRKAELADVRARTTEADQQINMSAQQVQLTQAHDLQNARAQLVQSREQLAAATAAMAQLAALKTVQNVKHEDRGTVITLSGSVLFASGKYELLSSAQETLANVANALAKSDPSSKIVVQGYTDSQGALGYNETLSQNRAETVRAFLTAHGLSPDRVTAKGLGPSSPVATNDSAEGRANNRRVEIVVTPPTGDSQSNNEAPSSTQTRTTTTAVVH